MSNTNCLFYYVSLRTDKTPIPGTMRAAPGNSHLAQSAPCAIGRITGQPMTAPAGKVQCFNKNGIRYYYRTTQDGSILPNSLFEHVGQPPGGQCVIEYKVFY